MTSVSPRTRLTLVPPGEPCPSNPRGQHVLMPDGRCLYCAPSETVPAWATAAVFVLMVSLVVGAGWLLGWLLGVRQ